jgi:hypothetical protein
MMSNFRNMLVSSLCNRLNADDKIMSLVDSPVLLVFGTDEASGLPLKVYEGARAGEDNIDKFAEVPYGIETGEAERIAVDGVSRGTDSDSAGKLSSSAMK